MYIHVYTCTHVCIQTQFIDTTDAWCQTLLQCTTVSLQCVCCHTTVPTVCVLLYHYPYSVCTAISLCLECVHCHCSAFLPSFASGDYSRAEGGRSASHSGEERACLAGGGLQTGDGGCQTRESAGHRRERQTVAQVGGVLKKWVGPCTGRWSLVQVGGVFYP